MLMTQRYVDGIVYKATNTVNGKFYIGATTRPLDVRRRAHISHAKSGGGCRIFNAALLKYGSDAFSWEVIDRANTHARLMRKEVMAIKSMSPHYNITSGGRGIVGVVRTAEWTAKISTALRGRRMSPERVEQMRKAYKPELHYRSVVCLSDGKWFNSIKAAALHYGMSAARITTVASEKETSDKYRFCYASRPLAASTIAKKNKLIDRRLAATAERKKLSRSRGIICSDGVVYASARDVCRKHDVTPSRVMQICQSGGSTRSGLWFRYADGTPPVAPCRTKEQILDGRKRHADAVRRGQETNARPVVCSDGKAYPTATKAAFAYGLSHGAVWHALKHSCGMVAGLRFEFIDSGDYL